jgi:hypothetical protein
MSQYRYMATNLLTGNTIADWIPLTVDSFSRKLGDVGELTGTLDLRADPAHIAYYVAALEPRRSMLWVLDDLLPVWGGIIWDWPHTSAGSHQLPIKATTAESILLRREIREDASFAGLDVAEIVRWMLAYASTGPGRAMPWMERPARPAGRTATVSYAAAESKKILDAIDTLASGHDFEILWEPGALVSDYPVIVPTIGAPTVDSPRGDEPILFAYPGNVLDYAFPRIGSASCNDFRATATTDSADGTQTTWISDPAYGQDPTDIANGYPLLQDSGGFPGGIVTNQKMVNTYANTMQSRNKGTSCVPSVRVAPNLYPQLRDIPLGSYVRFTATSSLHPADPATLSPTLDRLVRIIGWTAHPASETQDAYIDVDLGEIEGNP